MNSKKYLQVKQGILNLIAQQGLKVGEKLPSEKILAATFEVSIITARRALQELEEGGILRRQHGSGTYLSTEIQNSAPQGTIIFISIQSASSFLNTAEILRVAIQKRGHRLKSFAVGTLPDSSILSELKDCNGILVCGWITREWLNLLITTGLPIVSIGSNPVPGITSGVNLNWRLATSRLVNQMVLRDARKIALLASDRKYAPTAEMCKGYREALYRHGLGRDEDLSICLDSRQREQEIMTFFTQHRDIDAVIVEAGNLIHFLLVQRLMNLRISYLGLLSKERILENPLPATMEAWFPGNIFEKGVEMLFDSIKTHSGRLKMEMLQPTLILPPDKSPNDKSRET